MFEHDNDGAMRMPSPDNPASGYIDRGPGYAIGYAPAPAPEGMTFVPELGTYVDNDIAAQFGLGAPAATPGTHGAPEVPTESLSLNPGALSGDYGREIAEAYLEEMTDAELEALQQEIEDRANREPTLSPTLDDIANCFGQDFDAAVDSMVVGNNVDTVSALVEATGLDEQTAIGLIETTVLEASPVASEHIGGERWESIVYAAAATDDPFARRVVSDFVRGRLSPSKLMDAYGLWYQSLPDAEG